MGIPGRIAAALWLMAAPVLAGPPDPAGILGSWRVVAGPGAPPGTVMTFNPDGSRVLSDLVGTTEEDGWDVLDGRIVLGEEEVEFRRDVEALFLGATELVRYRLNDVEIAGRAVAPGSDAAGRYAPRAALAGERRFGEYVIRGFVIPDAAALAAGTAVITFELWDETEPVREGTGGATRENRVTFAATDWQIDADTVRFRAWNAAWGEVVLLARREAEPGHLTADLIVSGHILRGVEFRRDRPD
jgi:hypothetical protein